ncbi:DksA/TraR family C4-type zinc finger protein [Martelella alba]|uniref:DksA/TraR family C4-type zinc finger protein n=1 Tax=Martelella alba TaxID=2590451 RepID=A0ABY2SRE0_9HYPH|nr:DksA/TraR family C4-type zinc finger protein [Martelella alba]TKI07435.1 DksA/TraR family C4-type zinc finger protein [Martelella alba]
MASGWAPDGAVQDQIDSTIEDEVRRARQALSHGEGSAYCRECGDPIPEARRRALPGAQLCLPCQAQHDKKTHFSGYNRRGSKDSQLR